MKCRSYIASVVEGQDESGSGLFCGIVQPLPWMVKQPQRTLVVAFGNEKGSFLVQIRHVTKSLNFIYSTLPISIMEIVFSRQHTHVIC